jgi:hypothetical protein
VRNILLWLHHWPFRLGLTARSGVHWAVPVLSGILFGCSFTVILVSSLWFQTGTFLMSLSSAFPGTKMRFMEQSLEHQHWPLTLCFDTYFRLSFPCFPSRLLRRWLSVGPIILGIVEFTTFAYSLVNIQIGFDVTTEKYICHGYLVDCGCHGGLLGYLIPHNSDNGADYHIRHCHWRLVFDLYSS